jgi:hypothetical protein
MRWYFKRGRPFPRSSLSFIKKELLVKEGVVLPKTEWETMKARGYDRIWDAGATIWEKPAASNL